MFKKKGFTLSFIGMGLLVIAILFNSYFKQKPSNSLSFEEFVAEEQAGLQEYLDQLQELSQEGHLHQGIADIQDLFDREGISFFVLEKEQLIFWSEEESPVVIEQLLKAEEFLKTSSSLHLLLRSKAADQTYVVLEQVARTYPYKNRYLNPSLSTKWLGFQEEINSITAWNESFIGVDENKGLSWIFPLSLFAILLLIYSLPTLFVHKEGLRWLLILFLALLSRVILYYLDPFGWRSLPLFDPSEFAHSIWSPTAGDLFMNALTILIISYAFRKLLIAKNTAIISYISFLISVVLLYLNLDLVFQSVLNSQFNFELDNIFELEYSGLFVLFSFGLLFLSSLIFLEKSIAGPKTDSLKGLSLLWHAAILIAFYFLLSDTSAGPLAVLTAAILLLLLFIREYSQNIPDLIYILLVLICFSLSTSTMIDESYQQKESSSKKVLLQKLAEERDPLLEYLFIDIQEKIRNDQVLMQELDSRWDEEDSYKQYLRKAYFNAYWDRYRINFTLCSSTDSILVGNERLNRNCFDYFYDKIYREGDQISSINLFQLSNLAGRIDYIGEINLDERANYRLYLELSRDYFSEDLGYPELFLDEEDKKLRLKLDEYSYAVYFKDELINNEGDYPYKTHLSASDTSAYYTYQSKDFTHTVLQKNENIKIVLSKKNTTVLSYLSKVTYLFMIFGFLLLLFTLILSDFPFYHPLILTDFSTKIRLLITGTLLLALVFFMMGTTYYIQEQYELKNSRAIEEKLRSISLELDQKLGNFDTLGGQTSPFVSSILIKFSNVFYTDINLYDSTGMLYSSSRPEIYKQDLKSRRMNPVAYHSMIRSDRSKLVQEENIGKLPYLSAYIPFKNRQNKLLAYLNLPYFAKQEELEEEISAFLAPTINSYVIIFTLALLISFLMINQISKPLLLIRKHISGLKLGSSTELIEWQSNDEIGELVNEYNRIAIELGQSAEELAKSERETAWREMAKQIAHEIKNPLTPMKLSIQLLQRSASDSQDDLQAKIQRTSEMLISQIESLTKIAEAFSSFAKFPDKDLVQLELLPIVHEMSHLYTSQAEIEVRSDLDSADTVINADRDILLRILHNLIKNAIQAKDKEGLPKIDISLSSFDDDQLQLVVKDYGQGITEEQAMKIFEPSFTTKTSGTGLGLAVVKRGMEQFGGNVKMKSTPGEESSFYLYFPKA